VLAFIAVIVLSATPCYADWAVTYGGIDDDRLLSIDQTVDGGYIVAGLTFSFGAGDYDLWILKLDSDGTVGWQKTYGGNGDDHATSIQQTSDGGYIVAGGTSSFGAGSYDLWVLKLNSDGTIAWQKTYGGTDYDAATSVQQILGGGFVVLGDTWSFGTGSMDFWVLRLNPDGTVFWQRTYGGTQSEYSRSIQQTSDAGYIVAGSTSSFGVGSGDIWLLKLNSNGTIAWQKTYGGNGGDYPRPIFNSAPKIVM
jgi:hypothetical protein